MPRPGPATVEKIAQVVHESMRAWQKANGQEPIPGWGRAPRWMKDATIASVHWRIDNPTASASAQHEQWLSHKRADGWKHGRIRSAVKKLHPLMMPYSQLPEVEKRKDALLNALVDALARPIR